MNIYNIKLKKNIFLKESNKIVATSIKIEGPYVLFKTDSVTKRYLDENKIKYELINDIKKYKKKFFINLNLISFFILFLSLLYLNNYRISAITFNQETLINNEIRTSIGNKFKKLFWFNFLDADYEDISNDLRQTHADYEWIEVRKIGSVITVSINETKYIENSTENAGNIISTSRGIVTEVRVYSGKALVKKGDLIKEGDILIDGISQNKAARGLVLAEVFSEEEVEILKKEEQLAKTGNIRRFKLLEIFGKNIKLTKSEDFENYERDHKLIFNLFSFFRLYQIEDKELYDIIIINDYEKALAKAERQVSEKYQGMVLEEKILNLVLLYGQETDSSFKFRFLVKNLASVGKFEPKDEGN